MSGVPTEAEIQTQWRASVDILETMRAHVDATHAAAGGKWDTLLQALEGEYTPADLANAVNRFRANCATLLDPTTALEFLAPILLEYGLFMSQDTTVGFGANYSDLGELFTALYEWFQDKTLTVKSRSIGFDTQTAGASNVGNGTMSRLTEDANTHDLEACHVEKKIWRCRSDQNTGSDEHAEQFELSGEATSFDSILRSAFGSGERARTFIRSHHAGAGAGGSLLTNSSFSEFDTNGTPKFTAWTESAVPASSIDQDTTNFYRSHPGAATDASLEITGGLGTVTLKQTLANMRTRRLNPDTPYFLRVMLNKTVGTAVGGTVTIRMGSVSAAITIATLGANWQELAITFDSDCWPRNFNEDSFDIEIEWATSTSGTLLVDDVLFAPWDLADGTYWFLRQDDGTPVSWLVDDTLAFTDTGGAPATGKIQWWNFIAGLGYLPHSGSPSFTDP